MKTTLDGIDIGISRLKKSPVSMPREAYGRPVPSWSHANSTLRLGERSAFEFDAKLDELPDQAWFIP